MVVENSKGECNLGQHEINFRYADALRAADDHAIYKNGAKEIAAQEGMAITFMAKFDEREGNSCHIHFSLADDDGAALRRATERCSTRSSPASSPCLRELTLLLAPNINSYKRYRGGLVRADRGRLGPRQPHVLAARRRARRRRCASRTASAGADLNPYLALGAIIAAGLHGVDAGLELEPRVRGQRLRAPTSRACPRRCATRATCSPRARSRARRSATRSSSTTCNAADVELAAFEAAVTDWERFRGFERL